MSPPRVLRNARLTTLDGEAGYTPMENGVIVIEGEHIAFAGPSDVLPDAFKNCDTVSLGGRLVTPGLIDCHTHLVYGGSRAQEFEMRLNGDSYEEIARAGGGIASTVAATRSATDEDLIASSLQRLDGLLNSGVTTVEIKSGYGLDVETELRLLRIARQLEKERLVRVRTTFLGAHSVPKDISPDTYIDEICIPALRLAAEQGLVDAVDAYCETIAFSPEQVERVFKVAEDLGLPIKLHAEQLSDSGGAQLAATHRALSADHLEFVSEAGVEAMAKAGTIAVLLPGAFYFLKETQKPPVDWFRQYGVPMAVATDANPGTSPMSSILLAMNMAATLFGLTPEECLRGVTTNAAGALGLKDVGEIRAGQRADLCVWDVTHPAELTYRIGDAPLHMRIFGGQTC